MGTGTPRHVSGLLMLGLVTLPILFVWFLLRPGYAKSTRRAAFVYAFTLPILNIAAMAATGLAGLPVN